MFYRVKKIRILSVLLVFVMYVTMLPAKAYAAAPSFSTSSIGPNNICVMVQFSEGIYGNVLHTVPVTKEDFNLVFHDNGGAATNASISAIKTVSDTDPIGGESSLLFYLTLTDGPASGREHIALTPADANAIYNDNGEAMDVTASTGELWLLDRRVEFAPGYPMVGTPQPNGSKQVQLRVSSLREGVTAYCIVSANDLPAPDAIKVMQGKDGNGNMAIDSIDAPSGSDGDTEIVVNLPEDATDYDAYLVIQDEHDNFTSPVKLDIRTPDPLASGIVCRIGSKDYTSLDLALADVPNQTLTTITLLSNITDNDGLLIVNKKLIFDLNGYNLTINNSSGEGLSLLTLTEVNLNGTGNLSIDSKFIGLNMNDSKFITSSSTQTTINSQLSIGISADSDCEIVVYGDVSGWGGVYTNMRNTISVSGTVTARGPENGHAVCINFPGNNISVGNAIVASGTGAGIVAEDFCGGSVTVGSAANPGRVVGKSYGIWARYGTSPVTITVYGDVEGTTRGIYFDGNNTINIYGNVKTTGTTAEMYAVYGFVNGVASNITIEGNIEGPSGVYIHGYQSVATIKGNITATGTNPENFMGVYASYAKLNLEGNIAAANCTGVCSFESSEVTIDGTITAANYIKAKYTSKAVNEYDADSTKAGYLQYSSSDAFIWTREAATYTIAPIVNETLTTLSAGYVSGTQEAKSISLTKTGTGNLTGLQVNLSGPDADCFAITQPAITTLDNITPGTTFTLKARDGLVAGIYTATVTVVANNMVNVSFTVTQEITAAPVVSATVSPVSLSFDKNPSNQADVSTMITWNSATSIRDITKLNSSIGTDAYIINGSNLTLKKQYLASQGIGNLIFTIVFDSGNTVTLTVNISDTTPPVVPQPVASDPVVVTPPSPTPIPRTKPTLILTSDQLKAARDSVKDLAVWVEDEGGFVRYSWTFNGDLLAASHQKITDVKLALSVSPLSSDVELAKHLADGHSNSVGLAIDFEHEGVLPSQAAVRIYVGDQPGIKPGVHIFLYHYNRATGELETLPYSLGYVVDAYGYITLNILHCSDYVILLEKLDNDMITSLREQISVAPANLTLYVGGTVHSSADITVKLPITLELVKDLKETSVGSILGTVTVVYHSSNDSVATVDHNGKVTAQGKGTAKITTLITLYSGKVKTVVTTVTVKKIKKK